VDDSTPWLAGYRGLWGIFARDPISGENAPAGPAYNRDGTPRTAWYDPLNFCGLDAVPPPNRLQPWLKAEIRRSAARLKELERLIPRQSDHLQRKGALLLGMADSPYLARQSQEAGRQVDVLSAEVHALRREHADRTALLESLRLRLARLQAGERDGPRTHIRRLASPEPGGKSLRFERLAAAWAAVSLGLLLFAAAALVFFAPGYLWVGLGVTLILFVTTESVLRGALAETVARLTLLLAAAAALVLLVQFWKWILVAALVWMGAALITQRLRELSG
jgi:hypothetical protein